MQDITWPPPSDFTLALRYLRDLKMRLDRLTNQKPWNGVGSLCIIQLLLDMCAVGLVDIPTVDEMGEVVGELRAGGMLGLEATGHLTASTSVNGIRKAFGQFYVDVARCLTGDELERLPWNSITAEHTLCKFHRMLKKGQYKF